MNTINDEVLNYIENEIYSEEDILSNAKPYDTRIISESSSVIAICEILQERILSGENAYTAIDILKREYGECYRKTKNAKNKKMFNWMVQELEWIEYVMENREEN